MQENSTTKTICSCPDCWQGTPLTEVELAELGRHTRFNTMTNFTARALRETAGKPSQVAQLAKGIAKALYRTETTKIAILN